MLHKYPKTINHESGSGSTEINNVPNGDSNTAAKAESDIDRKPPASPKKRKSKANTSLRRESVNTAQSRSSSPKKLVAQKNSKGEPKSNTNPFVGETETPQWSQEVRQIEKWKDNSNFTQVTSRNGDSEEGGIDQGSCKSKSSFEKEYKKKKGLESSFRFSLV